MSRVSGSGIDIGGEMREYAALDPFSLVGGGIYK